MFNLNHLGRFCKLLHLRNLVPIKSKSKMSTLNKIAVCQMTSTNDKVKNLEAFKRLIAKAVDNKAKMAFFPEAVDYIGTSIEESLQMAETLDGPSMTEYKNIAKDNDIWISLGGVHEKVVDSTNNVKVHNSHVIIDNNGEIIDIYRKLHLFNVHIPEKNLLFEESKYTVKGDRILTPINTPVGAVGLMIILIYDINSIISPLPTLRTNITANLTANHFGMNNILTYTDSHLKLVPKLCYDLRFPEISTILRKMGAAILTYPSAFTVPTGQAHFDILIKARAIETQCYIVAACQYGHHNNKRISYGHSLIVDPWGNIVAECPAFSSQKHTDESIAIAVIEQSYIDKIRTEMPVLNHRRGDIYTLSKCSTDKINIDNNEYKFNTIAIPSSTVFYRSEHSYAFTNIRCVVPGHVLVTSLRVVPRLEDLTLEERNDFFSTVVKAQKIIELAYAASSSTICVQDGPDAGQTIKHVHCHILPRKANDFENNDDVYQKLANHERESEIRDTEVMEKEAAVLRQLC